jgi:hypothetical protein
MAPQSAARVAPRSGDRAATGNAGPRQDAVGVPRARCRVASSFGRNCSGLRGRTIRIVAFRAFHPAKPPSDFTRTGRELCSRVSPASGE